MNIKKKFEGLNEYFSPKVIGEVNDVFVKIAKIKGEKIPWHSHTNEDEMFLVIKGDLTIEFRDRSESLKAGDFIVIPRGVEHRPIANGEVEVLLFEPASTVNTGEEESELTRNNLESI